MPRDGAIIFDDLIGKLDVLRIECPKCGRAGLVQAPTTRRVVRPTKSFFTFMHEIAADCPGQQARSDNDPCGAIFSDLPKLL
jgi:hypothetical protein